jgi:hypothetical protein
MWRRLQSFYRPVLLLVLSALLIHPWVTGLYLYYNADPREWVEYAGLAIVTIGWLAASMVHDFLSQRMRNPMRLMRLFLVIMGASALIGSPLAFFGDWIYSHGHFALQQEAMQRYVDGGSACPALRCARDESVTAFVWGENDEVWTGACHDAQGVMAAAQLAAVEDRRAERPPTARVFGGVSRRSNTLSGPWIECAVRTPETAPR